MISVAFIFSHNPWLLPPAVEMIKVLKAKGNEVGIIYIGDSPLPGDLPAVDSLIIVEDDKTLKGKLSKELKLKNHITKTSADYYISCDLIAVIALYFSNKTTNRIYWSFEIMRPMAKWNLSIDFFRLEFFDRVLKRIDLVLIPTEERKTLFHQDFSFPISKIHTLRNSKSLHVYHDASSNVLLDKVDSGKIKVLYAGRFSGSQYGQEIIEAAALLPDSFQLIICGIIDSLYLDLISQNPNILYLGRLDLISLSALTEKCDIGLCFYNKSLIIDNEFPAPNKFGDYISFGLKLITSDQKYLKDLVEGNQLGKSLPLINSESIAHAIQDVALNHEIKTRSKIKDFFTTQFNMNLEVEGLLNVLKK